MFLDLTYFSRVIILSFLSVSKYQCLVLKTNNFKNNVCKNLKDYATIHDNTNCWFNPDVDSSPDQIAKRYGYLFEKHTAATQDGYLLALHRIPGKAIQGSLNIKPPILVQHGAAGSSALMMMQGNRSLAFILSSNGYDVWLANNRESYYSTHKILNQSDASYWKFGVNELAVYDIPACIDYIANVTGQKGNLIYVGHSLGTTTSYLYAIKRKQHATDNLRSIVSLAPVAYMKNVDGAFRIASKAIPQLSKLLRSFGLAAVAQFHQIQKSLLEVTCGRYLIGTCSYALDIFSGMAPGQLQPEALPVLFSYYPSGLSLRTLGHMAQFVNSNGEFRDYDFGSQQANLRYYNEDKPPIIEPGTISLPVYLFAGTYDYLSGLKDSMILLDKINANKSRTQAWIYPVPLAHMDFVVGKNVTHFYDQLLEVLKIIR